MNTLIKKVLRFFKRPKKYALLNLPTETVGRRGDPLPPLLVGGIIRARVLEETEQALKLRYFRTCFPSPFHSPRLEEYCGWRLKTDNRILEVYER